MQQKRLRVLLVDDHEVLLSGLRLLFENTADLKVIGQASNREDALEESWRLKPDVIVLDINLGETNGLELISEIRKINPKSNILLLTMYNEEVFLEKALEEGAKGYILKKASEMELVTAIRAVGRGETYVDPSLANSLVRRALGKKHHPNKSRTTEGELSLREKEVLGLVALGFTNLQIAEELVISVKTVESHKANIKKKLGINRRSDLVRYAMEQQLVPEN